MISIYTLEDLDGIRNNLDGDYVLAADIDMSEAENWSPIGTVNNPFTGTFKLNGHTLSNPKINRPDQDFIGVFGVCWFAKERHADNDYGILESPIFSNGRIIGADIKGRNNVGILAGKIETDIGKGSLWNSHKKDYGSLCDKLFVTGAVKGVSGVGPLCGNLAGYPYAGGGTSGRLVKDIICVSNIEISAEVKGTGIGVGGVVGQSNGVRIRSCVSLRDVEGDSQTGGICGLALNTHVFFSISEGDVTSSENGAGGICGFMSGGGEIDCVCSRGKVESAWNPPYPLPDADSGGTPWSSPANCAGGIIGHWLNIGWMRRACSFGNIKGNRAGGLVGVISYGGEWSKPNIENCFVRGEVRGRHAAGGLVGMHFDANPHSYPIKMGRSYVSNKVECTYSEHGGVVLGGLGPIYEKDLPGQTYVPHYEGEVSYSTNIVVNKTRNSLSNKNGGIFYSESDMNTPLPYNAVWGGAPETMIGGKDSDWILNSSIDPFPIFRWMHQPRSTMLSATWSKTLGLIMGYSQTNWEGEENFSQKVFLRRLVAGAWSEPKEVEELDGSNPRLNLNPTKNGEICAVSDVADDMHFAVTDANSLITVESQNIAQMNVMGNYGGLLHVSESGVQLYYYVPFEEINSLIQIDAVYAGAWDTMEFKAPVVVGSGANMSYLRTKLYGGFPMFSYRANNNHYILFPNIPWGEPPALPMPGENDPKYLLELTVVDEYGDPIAGAEIAIVFPYSMGTIIKYTDVNGEIKGENGFELWALTYSITISKSGYLAILGEDFPFWEAGHHEFTLYLARSNAKFTVSGDEDGNLEGAVVTIDDLDPKETNESGQCTFLDLLMGYHDYTVEKEHFKTEETQVLLDSSSVNVSVYLTKLMGTVTFTIIDADTEEPIEDAYITIEGDTIATDEDGEAVFEDIWYGTREYEVTCSGYAPIEDEFLLEAETLNIPLEMTSEED